MPFPHKITVFNKYTDEDDNELFQRSILDGVLFVVDDTSIEDKTELTGQSNVKIYIPRSVKAYEDVEKVNVIPGGIEEEQEVFRNTTERVRKKFISSNEFSRLDENERVNYFTLARGDKVSDGIVDLKDLTTSQFKNEFGNMYEVVAVSDYNFGSLANWYVIAR